LELFNYRPGGGNGNFQCFSYFLKVTLYFAKLNNLFAAHHNYSLDLLMDD